MAVVSILETLEHDWALVNSELFLCTDARAIAQHVEARLRLFLGEWFLDLREGVPYFENVFVKNPNIALVKSLLSNVVTETPGVTELTDDEFRFDRSERVLYYDIAFLTDTGVEVRLSSTFIMGDQ